MAIVLGGCVDLARPPGLPSSHRDGPGTPDLSDEAGAPGEPKPEAGAPELDAPDTSAPDGPDAHEAGPIDAPADLASPDAADGPVAPEVDAIDAPADRPADMNPPVDVDPGRPLGESCDVGTKCAAGYCVDGVCCETSCTEACHACNRPGSLGRCAPEPASTICASASCGDGVARTESRCSAEGQCVTGAPTACGPYACYTVYCGSACLASTDCAPPFTCIGNACMSAGLLLHWAFDEDSGNTVADRSGNGRGGTTIGTGPSQPQPSTNVAPLKFPNPRSRVFVAAEDHGVIGGAVPASIKTNAELTLAAWIRAGAIEPDGSDVICLGGDYCLRLHAEEIHFIRRKSTQPGQIYALAEWISTAHRDGAWHHVAGSSGAAGTKLYFDGVEVGSTANAAPTLFAGPDQIGVGHQPGNDLHEYDGVIDDVRIYGRVLSAAEIANLAGGNR